MRYAKNGLVIQPERDIPVLRQVRNSKFITHDQLFSLTRFSGLERSRDSFNWRLRRLLKAGYLGVCEGFFGAGSAVYRITRDGLHLLEHHGEFATVLHSSTQHLPHTSQIFHSLQLNSIQAALANQNVLATWQSEIEIASFNTISRSPYQKDYDAVVEVWVGARTVRFALEYERTLKSARDYERVRDALRAECQIACVLYLSSGMEVLVHLLHEFESIDANIALANANDFGRQLLDTRVLTPSNLAGLPFRELLQ
ncbi:MAG TPA: hypothetical protein VFR24_04545 [Candidatus Angelobacter sp.]|nr:hypothetical protein [Candidatus Angelobacter sp.]